MTMNNPKILILPDRTLREGEGCPVVAGHDDEGEGRG